MIMLSVSFLFQAEDGIRDYKVTGVQTCALPIFSPLEIGLQAIQPWPYRAGLAAPRPRRLQTATASLTCSCPLGLSPLGKSGDPKTSLRVPPDCIGDTTKRLTAHTGRARFRASGSHCPTVRT